MSEELFCQCRLKRVVKPGEIEYTTSWIPKKYAKKGALLRLKKDGKWNNGWEVLDVWETRTKQEVVERAMDFLHFRKASDI